MGRTGRHMESTGGDGCKKHDRDECIQMLNKEEMMRGGRMEDDITTYRLCVVNG